MGYPKEVGGALDGARVFNHIEQQLAVHLVVQVVDFVVGIADGVGFGGVEVQHRLDAFVQHPRGFLGHHRNVDQRLQRRLIAHRQADFGDALGIVAHPLQFRRDVQHRDNRPQIAGHRLLRGDEVEAEFLDFEPLPVDVVILLDHLARHRQVAVLQRLHRLMNGDAHGYPHRLHILLQLGQPLVEIFP